MNGKDERGAEGNARFFNKRTDSKIDKESSEDVEEDIWDMISERVKTSKLVVDSVGYPAQWPVRDVLYSWGKLFENTLYASDGGVI